MPTITSVKSDHAEATPLRQLVFREASTGRVDPVTLELLDHAEATPLRQLVFREASTGRVDPVTLELLDHSYGDSPSIRFLKFSIREGMDVSALRATILRSELGDTEYHAVFPVSDVFSNAGQAFGIFNEYDYLFPRTDTPKPSEQHTTADISLLDRTGSKEVATSVTSKLRERLSRFVAGHPDREPVSPETTASVNELVDWLCSKSDTVSATVSRDGMLSVATVFPKDTRLYVEIERDGSVEAAVTLERRYARDISGNTVTDLTPEVILAAVKRISSTSG